MPRETDKISPPYPSLYRIPPYPLAAVGLLCRALPAVGRLIVKLAAVEGVAVLPRGCGWAVLWPHPCRLPYPLRAGCSVFTWWASMCPASLSPAVMLGRI